MTDAVNKRHTHSNKTTLDNTNEVFNTEQKQRVENSISAVSMDNKTGVFTFVRNDGTSFTLDTLLEKVVVNFHYDQATKKLILEHEDGTTQEIPMNAFINLYTGVDGTEITVSVSSDNKISAVIKNGSIGETKLSSALLSKLNGKADASSLSKVATSNQYKDLDGLPLIPEGVVNHALRAQWYFEDIELVQDSASDVPSSVIGKGAKYRGEIIDLATFLNNMGAVIRGAGTEVIRIEGVEELKAQTPHTIIPDRIEAGTYVALAACIGNGIRIHNIIEEHLDSYLAKVEEMGVVIDADEDSLYVYPAGDLKMTQVRTDVYPGFATDLQQPITPLLLTAKSGEGVIIDQIYPKRVGHIPELQKMGANIQVEDNIILVHPTHHLHGAHVSAGEIRAGACLMLAGLMADGETIISNAGNILRGYDRIEQKLRQLGAEVSVIDV